MRLIALFAITLSLVACGEVPVANDKLPVIETVLPAEAPFTITVNAPVPDTELTQAVLAGTQLARFKITNTSSNLLIVNGLTFTNEGNAPSDVEYRLVLSDLNSTNYAQNKLSTTTTLIFADEFTVDGGSFRYITVAVAKIGSAKTGNTFKMALTDCNWIAEDAYPANKDLEKITLFTDLIAGKIWKQ